MRKNKKGFTLVELLAVIIILGILVGFSVPIIMKNINFSKNKSYTQDASKLISIAEYKINSNSLKIEKPDPGNCIVLSYDYLNDGSINNPPGKGSYLGSASFVVVKNNSGKFDYSAALIEEAKDGGYSGVRLSHLDRISNNSIISGTKVVDSYDMKDLLYIDNDMCMNSCIKTNTESKLKEKKKNGVEALTDSEKEEIRNNCDNNICIDSSEVTKCEDSNILSSCKVNEYLDRNNYVQNIEKIYTQDELEQGVPGDASPPKIVSAYVENGDIDIDNSKVSMKVNLVASDKDSDHLKICIKTSENDDFSLSTEECVDNYISGSLFVKEYKFDINNDPNKVMNFSIVVTDEKNNSTSTTVSKSFIKNKPPVVNASVTKRDEDKCNTYKAAVHVNVSDDRDLISSLSYCIDTSEKCSGDFIDHASFFNLNKCDENGNNCVYDYNVNNGNKLDGKDYKFYLHVKDSNDEVTDVELNYTVSSKPNPIITFELNPNKINVSNNVYNDLSGVYNLNISGTCSSDDKINLLFTSPYGIDEKMTYEEFIKNYDKHKYKFDGELDGKNRNVNLNITAEYGVNKDLPFTLTNVYEDKKPIVNDFSLESTPFLECKECTSPDSCGLCKGNSDVKVNLDVVDDLDLDLKMCLTEDNRGSCDVDSEFISLSEFNYTYSFALNGDAPYQDKTSNRKLYLFVKDSKNNLTKAETDYNLYVNKPPVISGNISVSSMDSNKNTNEVSIDTRNLSIFDDFNSYSMSVCYKYEGSEICKQLDDVISLTDNSDNPINKSVTIPIYIKVTDNYGESAESDHFEYSITGNSKPEIVNIYTKSQDEKYNTKDFEIYFKVYDPSDTYEVYLCENNNLDKDKCKLAGEYYGADNKNDFDINVTDENGNIPENSDYCSYFYESNWDYNDNNEKKLYLYFEDSAGNIVSQKIDYDLYKMCTKKAFKKISYYFDNTIPGNDEITYYNCKGSCINDGVNSFKSKYNMKLEYIDEYFGGDCDTDIKSLNVHCDHPLCLQSALDKDTKIYEYVIGNTKVTYKYDEETENGNVQNCSGYYQLYKAEVFDDSVILHEKVDDYNIACAELIGTSYLIRDEQPNNNNANKKYIRYNDYDYVSGTIKKCSDPSHNSGEPCL